MSGETDDYDDEWEDEEMASTASVVELCGRHNGRCGYCKSPTGQRQRTSVSFGLSARSLSCEDYQALIDRGWRRSGTYVYKPINEETCCPQYTIRLAASSFQPTKEQRQVLKRIQRLTSQTPLSKDHTSKSGKSSREDGGSTGGSVMRDPLEESLDEMLRTALENAVASGGLVLGGVDVGTVKVQRCKSTGCGKAHSPDHQQQQRERENGKSARGDVSSAVCLQLYAALRKAGRPPEGGPASLASILVAHLPVDVMAAHGASASVAPNGFINFYMTPQSSAPGTPTQVKPMNGHGAGSEAESSAKVANEETSSDVAVDMDGPATAPDHHLGGRGGDIGLIGGGGGHAGGFRLASCPAVTDWARCPGDEMDVEVGDERGPPELEKEWGHQLTVETVPSRVTEEVFQLYRKYQVAVHGDKPDDVTRGGFDRFLVQSPLIRETETPRSSSCDEPAELDGDSDYKVPYGSYHQLYRLDGKLIAVGVVDVLPRCVSSVYCFYDPDYRRLSLGKYTALREIQWVQEAMKYRPSLKYYYLGFYIHSCPKMRYKGGYAPSDLLCPVTYKWVPLAHCEHVLDTTKFAQFAPSSTHPKKSDSATASDHVAVPAMEGEHLEQASKPVTSAEAFGLVSSVNLDVGPLAMLHPRAQELLVPILADFVVQVGPELAPRLTVKLR